MDIKITQQENKTFVVLNGKIDTSNADQFQQDVAPLMEGENPDIEIDCTDMSYISSSGLRIFLTLRKAAADKGGKIIVRNICNDIRNVFMMTGFLNLFEIQ